MKTRIVPAAAAVAAAFLPLLLAAPAHATNGYIPHGHGIKAKGMGGAGMAMQHDALAAAGNPAGMAMLGNRVDFGIDWFRPTGREAQIVGSPAPFNGTTYDGDNKKNFFIPEFGYNRMVSNVTSLGVSVYGHGGMNTDYKTAFPLFGSTNPGVDLSQLFISPTLGYLVAPDHAVGVSLNLAYQRFKATGLENFTAPSGPQQFSAFPENVTDQGYDDSFGYGLSVGYVGRLTPAFSLGIAYRTKTKMGEFDKYKGLFAEEGGFDIPGRYGLGIAVKPTAGLTIAADIERIEYSKIKSINNPLLPNLFQAPLGTSGGAGFGWRDITVYKLGAEYTVSPQLAIRAGYNYGEQPIPASETLFNVLAPGVVKDHWTVGATWTLASKSELSFAFMYAPTVTVTGANSIPAPFGGGDVNLSMKQMSLGVAYGWKF